MGFSVGWSGVVFEEAGDADFEVREGEDLLLPVFEGVDVGEDYDFSSFEGCESFSREPGFTSGGQYLDHMIVLSLFWTYDVSIQIGVPKQIGS